MRLRSATSMISLLTDAGFWPWHRGVLTLGDPMSSQRSPVLLESLEISSTTKSRIQELPSNEPRNYLTSFILLLSRQLYASGLRYYNLEYGYYNNIKGVLYRELVKLFLNNFKLFA